MTIYVAICDDNIAQRKQSERLLNREKDSRLSKSGDVLYIESFGSSDALLKTPVKYDIFFIDVTSEDQNGMDIAAILREKGIVAPIVMISSTINYLEIAMELDSIYHVDTPISQNTISLMIEKALEWSAKKPPLVEVRCKDITHYVCPENIVRVDMINDRTSHITLSDGKTLEITETLQNFYTVCKLYNNYILLRKTIVNPLHVKEVKGSNMTLSNGDNIRLGLFNKNSVLKTVNTLSRK